MDGLPDVDELIFREHVRMHEQKQQLQDEYTVDAQYIELVGREFNQLLYGQLPCFDVLHYCHRSCIGYILLIVTVMTVCAMSTTFYPIMPLNMMAAS